MAERAALKSTQTTALGRLTRSRNALSALLLKPAEVDLGEVKSSFEGYNNLLCAYQEAHNAYTDHLVANDELDEAHREDQRYFNNECSSFDFCARVKKWIAEEEARLSEELPVSALSSMPSSKRTSSSSKSVRSARVREEAKIAELHAKSRLLDQQLELDKCKANLRAEEKRLLLTTELKMAEARRHTFKEAEQEERAEDIKEHPWNVDARPFEPRKLIPVPQAQLSDEQPKKTPFPTPPPLTPLLQQMALSPPSSLHPPTFHDRPSQPHPTPYGDAVPHRTPCPQQVVPAPAPTPKSAEDSSLTQLLSTLTLPQGDVPSFSGEPTEFHAFVRAFNAKVVSKTSNQSDLLYYLMQYVHGEAKEIISGCMHMSENGYTEAMALLQKEFGDPYRVASAYMSKINQWPTIRADDPHALKRFSTFLTRTSHAMLSLPDLSILDHVHTLQTLVTKLPNFLQNKWRDHVIKTKAFRMPVFQDLVTFVQCAAESANDPIFGRAALHPKTPSTAPAKASQKSFAISLVDLICPLCKGKHSLTQCSTFAQYSINDRRSFLKSENLCFACFSKGHGSRECTSKPTCTTCQKPHHVLLHDPNFRSKQSQRRFQTSKGGARTDPSVEKPVEPSVPPHASKGDAHADPNVERPVSGSSPRQNDRKESLPAQYACTLGADGSLHTSILQPIVPVQVRNGAQSVITYAFLDCGSNACFMTEDLALELGIDDLDTRVLDVRTMHGVSKIHCKAVENLSITDLNGNFPIPLPICYTQKGIPVDHSPLPNEIREMSKLSEAMNEIPNFMTDAHVGLLIGLNCPKALQPIKVIPNEGNGPFAIKYAHGWTINGPVEVRYDSGSITCHRVQVHETNVKEIPASDVLNLLSRDFTDLDTSYEMGLSQEDRQFLALMESEAKHVDGHFVMPLPFRDSNVQFPFNRAQAFKRAESQKRKMLADANYRADYVAFVDNLLVKGYAKKIPPEQLHAEVGRVWYLPHHGVYHPTKNKIRVVFDCSSNYQGVSLNDQLLQGPDLTNSLNGVLCRFRLERIAFIGDIEAMFHQARVVSHHHDYLRFLWWPNGQLDQQPQDYAMTVHLFGASSSPSVANFALRKTADLAEAAIGVEVANVIRHNFYVDDCLTSVGSEKEAIDLVHGLIQGCQLGGFKIAKFCSNNMRLLDSIPVDDRSKVLQKHSLGERLPSERALGVQWDPNGDTLGFDISTKRVPLTRRGILSAVSSIYDPLGMLAPFVLKGKQILQALCKSEIGWDDEIPQEYAIEWNKWCEQLQQMSRSIAVDRCMKSTINATHVEVHIFSDASSTGYGAVAYLRYSNTDQVHCAFLFGKSRIAPHKTTTIPRMELTAASVAARVGYAMQRELSIAKQDVFFHTDSTIVLHYISNRGKRFPVFVSNRVQMIVDLSEIENWRYIDSKQNPADIASRGSLDADAIASQWLMPPEFLSLPKSLWPSQACMSTNENEAEISCALVSTSAVSPTETLIQHYSNWHRLKFAVAVFKKVGHILSMKRIKMSNDDVKSMSMITVHDLNEAETSLVKFVQRSDFKGECDALSNGKPIQKASSIHKLDAFVEDGLLRVGGRLSKSDLPHCTKHPVLLPKGNHVTELVIRDAHERMGHAGRSHTLSEVRARYWIIRGNASVRKVINSCYMCRRYRKGVTFPKMADLPSERCAAEPPFTYCGVDLFGPFMIKTGRKEHKRYGAIFTCLASRAVHLEVCNSLETDSFIQSLRRFIARRGPVTQLRCDNGTNFRGAEKELRKALNEMDAELRERLLKMNIDWKFNPPASSHMGGVWERQIRSARKVLSFISSQFKLILDDESLNTLLCEVEAIMNSRPLSAPSSDPNDSSPLTPNALLTQKCSWHCPPPGDFQRADVYSRKRWRRVQHIADQFWNRWRKEFLTQMHVRNKWTSDEPNMSVGDVVVLNESTPRNCWPLARVVKCYPGSDGVVRCVDVRTQGGVFKRPVARIVSLVPIDEQCK